MIYVLKGNTIRDIALPLQLLTVEESSQTITDYYPQPTDVISVRMVSASYIEPVSVSVEDNYLHWEWTPELTGTYGIEVRITTADDIHMRSYRKQQIRVYNSNDQMPEDDGEVEFISEYLVLDATTVVWVKGDPGVGIASIAKTSTVGLVDTYTITYTDGTTSTFDVTNGQDATLDPAQIQEIINEVIASIDIPTKTSELTNDSGFITTEVDPTVPAWAKASSKPSYTASEVGAVPTTRTVNGKALSADITLSASDVNALPSSTVIPDAQIQSDWDQSTTTAKDYIKNKPTIPSVVDSLSSASTTAALSANQGKVLNDRLSAIQGTFDYTLPDAPVIWKSGYIISSTGVVGTDSAYRISEVIQLNNGETLNVADVTNNNTKPLFTCSTSTATDESTFTLLSAADYNTTSHTASYKNASGGVQYLVIVWRAANGQPTYTIAREGVDAPTLDEFNELETNPSLNDYIDFTKEFESSWTTYGYIIAATGLFSNSSNFHYVKFKRLSWMKKIRFMASGAVGSNASCIAFFSTDEVPTASDAKGFISAVQVLGLTDWVYEVNIPQSARMIIISNKKALSTNHLIQIGTAFDKEDANAIYNLNPRDEFFTKIANANRPSDANVQPLTLLHFSDLHSNTENLERITQFANDYHEHIADILDTGDDMLDSYADDATFFNNVPYGGKILRTIGNHDSALHSGSTYTWDYYTAQQCYEKYFTCIATWGVTYTENLCYYYKDYADSGIRLIVTDCMHPTDAQYTWIENTLADAQTNSLDVVVAVHYPVRGTKIDCSFSDSNAIVVASAQTFITNLVQKVDAFISGGGTFVTYLCGHMHRDSIGFAGGATNRQLVIMVDCSKIYHTHDTDRTRGEKSQDSFNIVSIDKNLKLVKVIKVGANRGHTMREKGLCTLRYGSDAGLVYDESGNYGTPLVNHGSSDTTFTIEPNVLHVWGEVGTLSITLSSPINSISMANEYMFQFESGSTATTLSPITGVSWIGGTPNIEANKTYQASIVNGIGVIGGV